MISRVMLSFVMSHVILGDLSSRVKRALRTLKGKKRTTVAVAIAHLPSFSAESYNLLTVGPYGLKSVKRVLSIVSLLWGVAVLGITIKAITNTSKCESVACGLRTYP